MAFLITVSAGKPTREEGSGRERLMRWIQVELVDFDPNQETVPTIEAMRMMNNHPRGGVQCQTSCGPVNNTTAGICRALVISEGL